MNRDFFFLLNVLLLSASLDIDTDNEVWLIPDLSAGTTASHLWQNWNDSCGTWEINLSII